MTSTLHARIPLVDSHVLAMLDTMEQALPEPASMWMNAPLPISAPLTLTVSIMMVLIPATASLAIRKNSDHASTSMNAHWDTTALRWETKGDLLLHLLSDPTKIECSQVALTSKRWSKMNEAAGLDT